VRKLKEGTTSIRKTVAICGVSKNTVLKVKRLLTICLPKEYELQEGMATRKVLVAVSNRRATA
jgi:hypothetical protein